MNDSFFQLQPSMIAANWGAMAEDAKRCEKAGIRILHLDVMDGMFVQNLTMGPDMVSAIKKAVPSLILDVHLMIYQPESYIERFIEAGADEITFHIEATEEINYCLDFIHKANRKAGLAIKPGTSENLLLKYIDGIDKLLVMTVEPGFGGQSFMEDMLPKVEFLRKKADENKLKIDIQVDGGVNLETGKKCLCAGANRLVAGSFFFLQEDLSQIHKQFQALFSELEGS